MTMKIHSLKARQILDSRGNPTIEVQLTLSPPSTPCISFTASVPSGASTGRWEACELRDSNPEYFKGLSVHKAISNINCIIQPALLSQSEKWLQDPASFDSFMSEQLDGTPNKSKLGANAILAVSMVLSRAVAECIKQVPLWKWLESQFSEIQSSFPSVCTSTSTFSFVRPMPHFNCINGGKHASNALAFQEFMLVPVGAASMHEAIRIGSECFHALRSYLIDSFPNSNGGVGDEGGFAPCHIQTPFQALELLEKAVFRAGHAGKVAFALDVAASEFAIPPSSPSNPHPGQWSYNLSFKQQHQRKTTADDNSDSPGQQQKIVTGSQLRDIYLQLIERFPLCSIEDPFGEDDWDNWQALMDAIKDRGVRIIADDLTVTNCERITKAHELGCCNGLLVKPNQIGTVSEAMKACALARSLGWSLMASHRSGETGDCFIGDFGWGVRAESVKFGAPCRGERVEKWNRLLWIAEQEGESEEREQ